MAKYDLYDIEKRLSEYDPETFRRIDFDERRGLHKIICYDHECREEYIAFTVPAGNLDARVVCDFMRINPKNGYRVIDELNKMEDEKQRREDAKISDMAHDLADNLIRSFAMKPSRSVD